MLITFEQLEKEKIEKMRGGEGHIFIQRLKDKDKLPINCKMYAKITIPQNSSIGLHAHQGDEEIIYVLDGKASIITEGSTKELLPGMINLTKENEIHSIINKNKEDLVILAVINEV